MLQIRSKWFVLVLIMMFILVACDNNPPDADNTIDVESQAVTEEPSVDLLIYDVPVIDPDAIYTFENPNDWIVYQGHLRTANRFVQIFALPTVDSDNTFEEYIDTWTEEDLDIIETEDGKRYASAIVGSTESVFVDSNDGVMWGVQMSLADDEPDNDAELADYRDDLMTIALSATYNLREDEE